MNCVLYIQRDHMVENYVQITNAYIHNNDVVNHLMYALPIIRTLKRLS